MTAIDQLLADWVNPPECRLCLSANTQLIPHNAVTPIAWDTEEKDSLGAFSLSNPTQIVIPANQGIVLFRATACFQWEWRGDYGRTVMMIAKNYVGQNSGAATGMPHDTRGSSVPYGCDPQHNATSLWMPCVPGDTITLLALHDNGAGAPANIVGSAHQTWIGVEFRRA